MRVMRTDRETERHAVEMSTEREKRRVQRLKWEKSLLTPIRDRLIDPPAVASCRADR